MVLELGVTLPLPSTELFTSKCFVEFFFSGSSRQARGQSCPTIKSGREGLELDWKAAYLFSASASVIEGAAIPLP